MTTASAAPAFDAEEAGVGERVAGHALHDGAGQAEGGADHQARSVRGTRSSRTIRWSSTLGS